MSDRSAFKECLVYRKCKNVRLHYYKAITQIKSEDYLFAKELIIDTQGHISKVVIDFSNYQQLLEAIEDEGLALAMKEAASETPLSLAEALAELENESIHSISLAL